MAGEKLAAMVGLGYDLEVKLKEANAAALKSIRENAKRLSERIAEKVARARVFSLLPKKGEVAGGGVRNAEIDFAKIARGEAERLAALIDTSDFVGVLQRYPVRESPALDAIVRALGFANRDQYEKTVRNRLVDDLEAVKLVRSLLGSLPADLTA